MLLLEALKPIGSVFVPLVLIGLLDLNIALPFLLNPVSMVEGAFILT
jgi:hypothetical protein